MSASVYVPPTTPFEPLTRCPSSIECPSFESLFFDKERDDARPEINIIIDADVDSAYDGDDSDSEFSDSDTVVMFVISTPRARPRTLSLENLPESTTRDVLAARMQENERRIEYNGDNDDEDEDVWSGEDDDSSNSSESDLSDDSDDEGEDAIISTLVRYEEMLGCTFVYGDEARTSSSSENTCWQALESIYDSVHKPSDTHAAALRIFSVIARMTEEEEDDYRQAKLFEQVKELVWGEALAWLELPDPEEELSLGLARFALIGQLVRLHVFDEDTVARVIEEFGDQLHVGGRMRVLQSLVRYAGPLVCTVTTADSLETVREACEARPRDSMMDWMYSKIKKDMLVHAYRIMCVGKEHEGRVEAEELLKAALILKEAGVLPTQYP